MPLDKDQATRAQQLKLNYHRLQALGGVLAQPGLNTNTPQIDFEQRAKETRVRVRSLGHLPLAARFLLVRVHLMVDGGLLQEVL
jgi:hypothetical protein